VLVRIIWRLSNIQPSLPLSLPNILVKLANANIFLLYFLMIAMPVSGATASLFSGHDISFYGVFTIQAFSEKSDIIASYAWLAHQTIAFVFIAAISAHILAALYHHFVLKDNVLRRMIR
jgi:cytochrome b561